MLASASFPGWAYDQLRRIGRAVLDGVLPPRCLACGEIVEEPHALCSRCWAAITFFAPPWCVLCGLPFPHPMGEDALCGGCARERPTWDQARAVLRYDKNSRRLVLGLKHGDRTHIAAAFGRWMHRSGGEVLAGASELPNGCGASVRLLGSTSKSVRAALTSAWNAARLALLDAPAPDRRKG